MVHFETTLTNLRRDVIRTFAVIDEWFDKDDDLHRYKPPGGGWSTGEVLEHVMLTSNYLLILIDKGTRKCINLATDETLANVLKEYSFIHPRLEAVGEHKSFTWERPEHMEPSGSKPLHEVRTELRDQLDRCLCTLELLRNGEGALYKTTMTVNDLGKLDVYQYIYFLSLHARRHVTQMKAIEEEFNQALSH